VDLLILILEADSGSFFWAIVRFLPHPDVNGIVS